MDFNKYEGMMDQGIDAYESFYWDAMLELDLIGRPESEELWSLAWKHGHLYGFKEVFFQLRDLKSMLVKELNERMN